MTTGILRDGKLDRTRLFNSDECPNPMNGNPSGTRTRRRVVAVMKNGRFQRPITIAAEHDENITIDPIVDASGRMWTTQARSRKFKLTI